MKDTDQSVAKLPLQFNGDFAKLGLTPIINPSRMDHWLFVLFDKYFRSNTCKCMVMIFDKTNPVAGGLRITHVIFFTDQFFEPEWRMYASVN